MMTCAVGRLFAGAIFWLLWPHVSYNLWAHQMSQLNPGSLELSGSAVPSRFVQAVGEKAGVWGFENGVLEGWVYPLKIFHDFRLAFQIEGSPTIYAGEQLIRAVRVRPESVDLQNSDERFTVTET